MLEIIGESARALSDEARARYPEVPWSDVIGLRTVLAHHYHRVDPDQVWTIATQGGPGTGRTAATYGWAGRPALKGAAPLHANGP